MAAREKQNAECVRHLIWRELESVRTSRRRDIEDD